MDNEVLDSPEISESNYVLKEFTTPIIVGALSIFSIYLYFFKNLNLNVFDYFAFLTVFISIYIYFKNKKAYVYILTFVFAIGTFNLIGFTPLHFIINFSTGLTINDFGGNIINIGIQPVSLILFIINYRIFKKYFKKSENELKKIKIENNILEVERMKSKFINKTNQELEQIINGKGYRAEAIEAAKELLKEKNVC